jgi:pimeloyl-ACP methyl ester carboxylesterase
MGAVVCAQVAEEIPDSIRALVAVAAAPPVERVPMIEAVGAADPEYVGHFLWAPDRRTARIRPEGIRDFLYQQCTLEFFDLAVSRFTPEPVAPYLTPIRITPERYGRTPRYYIACSQDRVVTQAVQRLACSTLPPDRVYTIDADHAPFFSAPEALTNRLDAIAKDF